MRKTIGVLGLQWGDEGKGKLVHHLSQEMDIVARYNGGNNAGHTIVTQGKSHIFRLVPSGMLHPNVKGVIGSGTVIHPSILLEEIEKLHQEGLETRDRLYLSRQAHIIMPYHLLADELREKARKSKIGTTKRGIGPCYTDKIAREGIRLADMQNIPFFSSLLRDRLEEKAHFFKDYYHFDPLWDFSSLIQEYVDFAHQLEPYIADTSLILNKAMEEDKNILLESAQGTLLDIDFGTYPFVTSCSSIVGGACSGLGIPPGAIGNVTGVFKAYTTRVGEGPFPTEIHTEEGRIMLEQGQEFGTVTGRPRRCGWIDLPALQYSIMINGVHRLALMKLDVLDTLDQIKICTGYKLNNVLMQSYPCSLHEFASLEPVYETLPGWKSSTRNCRHFEDLPLHAKQYIKTLENQLNLSINIISTGPDRKETIER